MTTKMNISTAEVLKAIQHPDKEGRMRQHYKV